MKYLPNLLTNNKIFIFGLTLLSLLVMPSSVYTAPSETYFNSFGIIPGANMNGVRDIELGDLDRDGDLDIIVGYENLGVYAFENKIVK